MTFLKLEILCGGLLLAGCGVQDAVRHASTTGTTGATGTTADAGPLVCTTDTFEDYALPFFRTNCERCHEHTTEFDTADEVLALNDRIQFEIVSGAMPQGTRLAAADQAQILHWLQCQQQPVVLADGGVIEADAGPPCVVPDPNGPYAGPSGEEGKDMLPGQNCLACHVEGSTGPHKHHDDDGDDGDGDDDAPGFRVAGTVFQSATSPVTDGAANVHVILTDALQHRVTLTTRPSGNFYLKAKDATGLTPPLRVKLSSSQGDVEMVGDAPTGACNTCHTVPAACDAPGRLHW